MIEVLYGEQTEIINKYINTFIKKNKIDNVIKYDYNESSIDEVLNETMYMDLFGGKKIIILYNSNFLTGKSTLESKEFDKYLSNPNPNIVIFFVLYESALDKRKKIVKMLEKNFKITEFNTFSLYEAENLVKNSFKDSGYNIEYSAVKKMVEFLSTNYGMYESEIEKLKIYKSDDKNITLDDVLTVTSKVPEDNVFKLVEAVITNNKESIFKIYKDIKETGTDDIALIALLSSQFRFLYQVSALVRDGKSMSDIITLLGSHPYKTEITMKKVNLYKEEEILDIMYKLSIMDIKIKSGESEKSRVLEEFFLEI